MVGTETEELLATCSLATPPSTAASTLTLRSFEYGFSSEANTPINLYARRCRSHPNAGIVTVKTTGYNQDGTVVISFKRTIMVYKTSHAPETHRPILREE